MKLADVRPAARRPPPPTVTNADPAAGAAEVFGDVLLVAAVMVAPVLVPAFFLPRRRIEHHVDPALLAGH